ncbi:MAG: ABC transporter ATP-binding protein [Candidatus Omnitrophica bacterium]|nr:ABC transporter ATP-binding protein [Candidatus Omnitrophota bacterium]
MSEEIIQLSGIGKKYTINFGKRLLITGLSGFFKNNRRINEVWALRGIGLSIKKGECVGIIGENASGKTTLLRIISGITAPVEGTSRVKGKVAGFLDLSAGFHPELTGRENIYLNGALYGMGRREIETAFDKIVEFSGISEFIDAQVKTYSQGMLVRLGFSVAVHTDPDIFLIDDSLAVGDEEFQRKCFSKIMQLKEEGKTIIIVSHDLDSISRICQRGVLLKQGNVIKDGLIHKVVKRYIDAVGDKSAIACIDKGNLSVIFNNGKIVLLWDGKPLTKNFGGYVSFELSDNWMMSWQAQWMVVERQSDFWKAEGVFAKNNIRILLECEVNDESLLKLRVHVEFLREIPIKKAVLGFMFNEKYNRYLHEDKIETIHENEKMQPGWQDIFRTDERNPVLAFIPDDEMPGIMADFEHDIYPAFGLIQVTDKQLDARVMQMQMVIDKNCYAENKPELVFSCAARIAFLNKEQAYVLAKKKQTDAAIKNEALSLRVESKGMRLFYDDIELTKYKNLLFGFFSGSKYFDIFSGRWLLQKQAANSLIVYADFRELKIRLKLSLVLDKDLLDWDICAEGADEPVFDCLSLQAFLTEKMDRFFNLGGECGFPLFCEHNESVKLPGPDTGFIGVCSKEPMVPAVVFGSNDCKLLHLENCGFDVNARMISLKAAGLKTARGNIRIFTKAEEKNNFILEKQKQNKIDMSLSADKLAVEFMQGKIVILKNDIEITADEGFCSGIYMDGRWHESKHLAKKFFKEGNTLKVFIKRQIPQINELWNITLDDGAINWSVVFEFSASLADFSCKVGIILKSNFRYWTHSFSDGEFFGLPGNNQVIDLNDVNNTLLGARTLGKEWPVLFFERIKGLNHEGVIIEESQDMRCFQFKFKGEKQINDDKKHEVFFGKIMLEDQSRWDENISRYRLNNFSLILNDKMQLLAEPGKIKLLAVKREVTRKDGLRISLITDNGTVDSYCASWQLEKVRHDLIISRLNWDDIGLAQYWYLESKDNAVEWTVILDLKQRLKLKELFMNMFVDFSFNNWATSKHSGKIDFKNKNSQSVAIFDNRSDFVALFMDNISSAYPALIFNPLVDMREWVLNIYRYHMEQIIACGVYRIFGPDGKYFAAGEHEIFKGRILLSGKNEELTESVQLLRRHEVDEIFCERLKLEISKAGIDLFWEDKQLTKTLGFYTAFYKDGVWIDSSLGCWQAKIMSEEAYISLLWNKLQVSQSWKLKIINEHEISWQIDTQVQDKDVTSLTAALMLADTYDRYQTVNSIHGEFPLNFQQNNWSQVAAFDVPARVFTENQNYPEIIFQAKADKGQDYINVIENSDILHSARVLKCEAKVSPNKSTLLSRIIIEIKIIVKERIDGR